MVVHQFIEWTRSASPTQRAEGASELANAWLVNSLDDDERHQIEAMLTALLDDQSPIVRRSLAEIIAHSDKIPRHMILALAADQPSIAAIVLGKSPLLTDADLIDCVAIAGNEGQCAVAERNALSMAVGAKLADVATCQALVALARNSTASVNDHILLRMVERFGEDGDLREAIHNRADLSPHVRQTLVSSTASTLEQFVNNCQWMTSERSARMAREAREKATIQIAACTETQATANGTVHLVQHLRAQGQLTAGLILRALLSGNLTLFEAALCNLSGLPAARVASFVRNPSGSGYSALYRKAELPPLLQPAFKIALESLRQHGDGNENGANLSRKIVDQVLKTCEGMNKGHLDQLISVLRRFETEAAREEYRVDTASVLHAA